MKRRRAGDEGCSRRRLRLLAMLIITSSIVWRSAAGLKLTNMTTPAIADPRDDMELDCHFDMGIEKLYSIKWYKDDHEFFRYMPYQQPHIKTFPVFGVHVAPHQANCGQTRCKIRLTGLSRDHTSGSYRCEISSDAPTFRLASETHNITVAALPKYDPELLGLHEFYQYGDTLIAECKSSESDPLPEMSWYINDVKAPTSITGEAINSIQDGRGLSSKSVTLRFQVDRKYTQGNLIRLRCLSTIPGISEGSQTVTKSVTVRTQPGAQVNNEKLHWSDVVASSSNQPQLQIDSLLARSVAIANFLILVVARSY